MFQFLWCLSQIAMCTRPPSYLHQMSSGMQTNQWSGHNPTPWVSIPQALCGRDPEIDADNLGRSYPQVNSPPVFSPPSSNCSSNGGNIPTQSHNEHLDTQAEAWILDGNISNYDHDDNHSQPSLGDENTHCCDSGYHSGSASLKGCSDLDSSDNHDQDSWLTLDNS